MYATELIEVTRLKPFPVRDIRPSTLEKIKKRITESGYNPARPLSVVKSNGSFLIADGNHRFAVIQELNIDKVPCVVYEEGHDPYALAVNGNQDEDTYAPMDLFDWLDVIAKLQDEGLTQEKIGERIGWSREKVKDHVTLRSQIGAEILILAKTFQEGRAPKNGAAAPKNERNVTTFDFGEWWFRNSGLYELEADDQMKVMEWFCVEEKCKAAKKKLDEKVEYYKGIRSQLKMLEEQLSPEISYEKKAELLEAIHKGEYSGKRLESVIKKLNEGVKNKAKFGVDALDSIKTLSDNEVDVVITDPPYGVDFKSSRRTGNPEFDDSLGILEYFDDLCVELKRVCKENAHIYVFCGCVNAFEFKRILSKHFEVHDNWLTWVKNNHTPCDFKARYASKYEIIWFCTMPNGKERKLNNSVSPDVLEFAIPQDKVHDCQKPEPLLEYLIKNSSGLGEVVLDPFAGSGSTLLAAAKCGRHFIGFEKEEKYSSDFSRKYGDVCHD